MIRMMLARWIDGFEKSFAYDASYMRHVLRVSPASLLKFAMGTRAADVKAAPHEALIAAGLVGTRAPGMGLLRPSLWLAGSAASRRVA